MAETLDCPSIYEKYTNVNHEYLLELYRKTEEKTKLPYRFLYQVTKPYSDKDLLEFKPKQFAKIRWLKNVQEGWFQLPKGRWPKGSWLKNVRGGWLKRIIEERLQWRKFLEEEDDWLGKSITYHQTRLKKLKAKYVPFMRKLKNYNQAKMEDLGGTLACMDCTLLLVKRLNWRVCHKCEEKYVYSNYDYLLKLFRDTEEKTKLPHKFLYHITEPYSDPDFTGPPSDIAEKTSWWKAIMKEREGDDSDEEIKAFFYIEECPRQIRINEIATAYRPLIRKLEQMRQENKVKTTEFIRDHDLMKKIGFDKIKINECAARKSKEEKQRKKLVRKIVCKKYFLSLKN